MLCDLDRAPITPMTATVFRNRSGRTVDHPEPIHMAVSQFRQLIGAWLHGSVSGVSRGDWPAALSDLPIIAILVAV